MTKNGIAQSTGSFFQGDLTLIFLVSEQNGSVKIIFQIVPSESEKKTEKKLHNTRKRRDFSVAS